MPEGDTVFQTARALDRALTGEVVRVELRVPHLAGVELSTRVTGTAAVGKHLLTSLETGPDDRPDRRLLHTHLKMEGAWHLYRPDEKWQRPAHEARAVLSGETRVAVGFALGVVELVADRTDAVGHLGPDLLGADWDPAEAVRRLSEDPTRPLAEALLDQRNLAGVGNLYANELCFLAGCHPRTPVRDVPDLSRVVRRAHAVLLANRDRTEQATTGDLRPGRRTWVYRREGQPCRRCGARVRRDEQQPALGERVLFWCPHCQPDRDAGRPSGDLGGPSQ